MRSAKERSPSDMRNGRFVGGGVGKNSCPGLILSSQSYLGNENMLHAGGGEISHTKKNNNNRVRVCVPFN